MSFAKKIFASVRRRLESAFVQLLPSKRANLMQCGEENLWDEYFERAEADMDSQWNEIIYPLIQDFDFETVLELAPGTGRNTEKLCRLAKKIYAVDYNRNALEQCRERLGEQVGDCRIEYHTNNGTDLAMIPQNTISAIYCWDAAVHFDKEVIADYVAEFARVLKPGGKGFVHHSNLGARAAKDIKKNPHWRSNMSKVLFAGLCQRNGLRVLSQTDIAWGEITDCASIFTKDKID